MKLLVALSLVSMMCLSQAAQAITVDEAYAAIPHQRTVFQANVSRMSRPQVDSLTRLFNLADQATVLRVEAQRAYQTGDLRGFQKVVADYVPVTNALKALRVPTELAPVQDLVVQAVQDHHRFYERQLKDSAGLPPRTLVFTPEVHQASQKLRSAYGVLMQSFPGEPAVNKTAFFDYLCALDFL